MTTDKKTPENDQSAPAGQGDALADEIDLIRAVLDGYPESIARSDALRATRVIRAALAARQPEVMCNGMTEDEADQTMSVMGLSSARQPVGQEPVQRLIDAVEGECDGFSITTETATAILAHVFPTGPVAVAYMVDGRIEQGLFFDRAAAAAAAAENTAAMNAGEVVPLFRSPAQAVDLGQFREAVAYAARSADFATHVEIGSKLRELLALIDGKAE